MQRGEGIRNCSRKPKRACLREGRKSGAGFDFICSHVLHRAPASALA